MGFQAGGCHSCVGWCSSTELSLRASALQSTSEFGFSFEALLKLGVCCVMTCFDLGKSFFLI